MTQFVLCLYSLPYHGLGCHLDGWETRVGYCSVYLEIPWEESFFQVQFWTIYEKQSYDTTLDYVDEIWGI